MKRLDLRIVMSLLEPGELSLRSTEGSGTQLKRQLSTHGFEPGERVALVPAAQLDELLRKAETCK